MERRHADTASRTLPTDQEISTNYDHNNNNKECTDHQRGEGKKAQSSIKGDGSNRYPHAILVSNLQTGSDERSE